MVSGVTPRSPLALHAGIILAIFGCPVAWVGCAKIWKRKNNVEFRRLMLCLLLVWSWDLIRRCATLSFCLSYRYSLQITTKFLKFWFETRNWSFCGCSKSWSAEIWRIMWCSSPEQPWTPPLLAFSAVRKGPPFMTSRFVPWGGPKRGSKHCWFRYFLDDISVPCTFRRK